MPKIIVRSNLIKGVERGFIGWSITNILIGTSIVCVLLAATIQFLVLSQLSAEFRSLYEKEVSTKVVAQMDAYRSRVLRSLQSQSMAGLNSISNEALKLDPAYELIFFYDAQGRLLAANQKNGLPRSRLAGLAKSTNLKSLMIQGGVESKLIDLRIVKTKDARMMDLVMGVDLHSEFNVDMRDSRLGYMRLMASLERMDTKLEQIRVIGVILVTVTTVISTFVFLFLIRKTVTDPVERAVHFMETVVENIDRVPAIQATPWDALQVRQLMKALHAGMSEISIRHRSTNFVEETRKSIENQGEDSFLPILRDVWMKSGLVTECQLMIVRQDHETGKFLVERTSQQRTLDTVSVSVNRAAKPQAFVLSSSVREGMSDDVAMDFLSSGQEIQWSDKMLHVKAPLNIGSDAHLLVLTIIPNSRSGMSLDRFEELSLIWVLEVTRLYQEVRYHDLAGKFELARELQRRWVQTERRGIGSLMEEDLDAIFACDSIPSHQVKGDFLFAYKYPSKGCSLTVLGDVSGHDIRAGLAATGIVAALSDRFQFVKDEAPADVLEALLRSVNTYMATSYHGELCAGCTAIFFDHQRGMGWFACYGLRYPLLLTPHERKPMVIALPTTCGPLGLSEDFNFVHTSFPVYPGQVVFASTSGFFDVQSLQGQRFEKSVLSGALSECTGSLYTSGAAILLQKYFENARQFSGARLIQDDLTGVVLMRKVVSGQSPI